MADRTKDIKRPAWAPQHGSSNSVLRGRRRPRGRPGIPTAYRSQLTTLIRPCGPAHGLDRALGVDLRFHGNRRRAHRAWGGDPDDRCPLTFAQGAPDLERGGNLQRQARDCRSGGGRRGLDVYDRELGEAPRRAVVALVAACRDVGRAAGRPPRSEPPEHRSAARSTSAGGPVRLTTAWPVPSRAVATASTPKSTRRLELPAKER